MRPVIVCIAKLEHDYIEEFVSYHLALGFHHIYVYDNEPVPTYESMLSAYKRVTVIHDPTKGIQLQVLKRFADTYLFKTDITHMAHLDVDEFIALKKHASICDFINEYMVGDCQGIGMNWRFFGSAGRKEKTYEPLTLRFTKCQEKGNHHIKTLFKKDYFLGYQGNPHSIQLSSGFVKSTNGAVIQGPFNKNIDLSVIQLNHYKTKTWPEFQHIRTRGVADRATPYFENVENNFKLYDCNETEDLTAYHFYKENFTPVGVEIQYTSNLQPALEEFGEHDCESKEGQVTVKFAAYIQSKPFAEIEAEIQKRMIQLLENS